MCLSHDVMCTFVVMSFVFLSACGLPLWLYDTLLSSMAYYCNSLMCCCQNVVLFNYYILTEGNKIIITKLMGNDCNSLIKNKANLEYRFASKRLAPPPPSLSLTLLYFLNINGNTILTINQYHLFFRNLIYVSYQHTSID